MKGQVIKLPNFFKSTTTKLNYIVYNLISLLSSLHFLLRISNYILVFIKFDII